MSWESRRDGEENYWMNYYGSCEDPDTLTNADTHNKERLSSSRFDPIVDQVCTNVNYQMRHLAKDILAACARSGAGQLARGTGACHIELPTQRFAVTVMLHDILRILFCTRP